MSDNNWQQALKLGFYNPKELLNYLEIESSSHSAAADKLFKTRVPREFAAKMRRGDETCPLLRQVLPLDCELKSHPGYGLDPLGEHSANKHPGLLHKYHGRLLVMLATTCAINCRYCFRRHFAYKDNQVNRDDIDNIVSYIKKDTRIHEVILSGGDSLMLTNKRLDAFIERLESISHVKTLRIHSRLPVVIPARIDEGLLELLNRSRLNKVMVLHVNHAQELCTDITNMVAKLKRIGVTLLNQSVLLKGVNDCAASLISLSRALFDAGILPYYLHLLDKVQGSAHFDISKAQALLLYKEMREKLPGYLVPRLVEERDGEPYKSLVLTASS